LSRLRSMFTFLYICSVETLVYSFLSSTTLTPRYLTFFTHFTPDTSWVDSLVNISDFFLFSLRFHLSFRDSSSLIANLSSPSAFVITNISSANASKSPRTRIYSNFVDDLMASSKYTLNKTGDRIEPCGRPISALMECPPIVMSDSEWSLLINLTNFSSDSSLHLYLSRVHRIPLSTESYAFCRSMSILYFLFFGPWTSYKSLLACIAVDLASLNPV